MASDPYSTGLPSWQTFVTILREAKALNGGGNRPRGAGAVDVIPQDAPDGGRGSRTGSWLGSEWDESVSRADKIIYFYNTPIAYTVPMFGWVVPDVSHTATTTGAQNRIRAALKARGISYAETPGH